MKITTVNLRTLLPSLLLPAVVGGAGAIIVAAAMPAYSLLKKAPLVPPPWVFAVVWTVLYLLMGLASYRVKSSSCFDKQTAAQVYYIQLALNFMWVVVFFRFGQLWGAVAVLAMLIAAIIMTVRRFSDCDKTAAKLLVPYLIWSCIAMYFNIATAVLN